MKAYIDANVFFLAAFSMEEKGRRAREVIRLMQDGRLSGYTSSLALDEIMWAVLKQKKGEALREVVENVYALYGLEILDTPAEAPLDALEFMGQHGLKPRDAIHCAVMRKHGISTIYSDDSDFDRIKQIKRRF